MDTGIDKVGPPQSCNTPDPLAADPENLTECENCGLEYLGDYNEDSLQEIWAGGINMGWWCPQCLERALSFWSGSGIRRVVNAVGRMYKDGKFE